MSFRLHLRSSTVIRTFLIIGWACMLIAGQAAMGTLTGSFGCGGATTSDGGSGDIPPSGGGVTPEPPAVTPTTVLSMQLDPAFGISGTFTLDSGRDNAQLSALLVQADGKVLASGYYGDVDPSAWPYSVNTRLAVMRFTAQGVLDPAFGAGGIAWLDCDSTWGLTLWSKQGMALQSDGRIVVGGECDAKATLFRLNADGTPDNSFDGDGRAELPAEVGGLWATVFTLTMQQTIAGEKILIGGQSNTNNPHYWTNRWLLARLDANGALDNTFAGGAGILYQRWTYSDEGIFAIALNPAGDLIVYGGYQKDAAATADFAVARYSADGVLDTAFGKDDADGIDGLAVIDFGHNDWAYDMKLAPDGKIVGGVHVDDHRRRSEQRA